MTTVPCASPPKRLKGEQRRALILDAATALFGRHGFNGTTTKALAEAAGVSEATIFKHFPTKHDLYTAAFERRTSVGTEQLIADLEADLRRGDDEGLVRRVFVALLWGYEHDRDLHRMLQYAWLEQDDVENNRLARQMREYPLVGFLERYVAQRQAEGVFAPGAPRLIAAALITLPTAHAMRTKLHRIDAGHDDEEVVDTFTRLLLDGVRVPRPAGP